MNSGPGKNCSVLLLSSISEKNVQSKEQIIRRHILEKNYESIYTI
jgi:hypothetical protein